MATTPYVLPKFAAGRIYLLVGDIVNGTPAKLEDCRYHGEVKEGTFAVTNNAGTEYTVYGTGHRLIYKDTGEPEKSVGCDFTALPDSMLEEFWVLDKTTPRIVGATDVASYVTPNNKTIWIVPSRVGAQARVLYDTNPVLTDMLSDSEGWQGHLEFSVNYGSGNPEGKIDVTQAMLDDVKDIIEGVSAGGGL